MLRAGVDALRAVPLEVLEDADVLRLMAGVELHRRQLEGADLALVAQAGDRSFPFATGATSLADLVAGTARVSRAEARARVQRSVDLGPRRAVSGEALAPIHPITASALHEGEVSGAHCDVITSCLGALPPELTPETVTVAEGFLVEAARHSDPQALRRTGQLLHARLDPDGRRPSEEQIGRRRHFGLRDNADGAVSPYGVLTPECVAVWRPILDALAAPLPAADGVRDDRTAGQRMHDALFEAGQRVLRSGTLPDSGGLPVTVLVRTTAHDLSSPSGVATTAHGDVLSVAALERLAGEGEVVEFRVSELGGVLDYGRTQRFAGPGQRKALAARDGGCSFPGCSRPAAWTEVHHVIEWEAHGRTNVDEMCLVCSHHHRSFEAAGWRVDMIDGIPWWTPPAWLDHERQPLRNRAHHPPEIDFGA